MKSWLVLAGLLCLGEKIAEVIYSLNYLIGSLHFSKKLKETVIACLTGHDHRTMKIPLQMLNNVLGTTAHKDELRLERIKIEMTQGKKDKYLMAMKMHSSHFNRG